jgi:hypothetical protein
MNIPYPQDITYAVGAIVVFTFVLIGLAIYDRSCRL